MLNFINGRFLSQNTSGVQRFARQIISALDEYLRTVPDPDEWVLLVPRSATPELPLSTIRSETVGQLAGHFWEQTELLWASRSGKLVNLCNSGPILHPKSLTVIHDAMVFRTPENYSKMYRSTHRTLQYFLKKRSQIATVSHFSARELSSVLGLNDVPVLYNGCDHLNREEPEIHILSKHGLHTGSYLLFIGSPSPNKNLSNAIEAIQMLGDKALTLVIVGSSRGDVFQALTPVRRIADPAQVVFTGRLSDAEIVALLQNARALLFPSLYEGFGIPPLEAMTVGCPVLASDIEPVREVCADAAAYFDPKDPTSITRTIKRHIYSPERLDKLSYVGRLRANRFSWSASAEKLCDLVLKL